MKKHLKIFLTTIVLTFSFCFVSKVKAWTDLSNFILPDGVSTDTHDILIEYSTWRYGTGYFGFIVPKNDNKYFYHYGSYSYPTINSSTVNSNGGIRVTNSPYSTTGLSGICMWSWGTNPKSTPTCYSTTSSGSQQLPTPSTLQYTNTTIYSASGVWFNPLVVNFHLNDSTVWTNGNNSIPFAIDNFEWAFENSSGLSDFIDNHTVSRSGGIFQGWYYDSNYTQPYNSSDNLTGSVDLYAKFGSAIHTFNFHLNGGWVYDPTDSWGVDEDFSFSLYQDEVETFFSTLEVHKYMMLFEGWYYDPNFTQPFTINDTITSDVDLYAKYRYERVDDFLSNTTLNEHTFDTSYSYAIINRGDNGDSVYIGLPFEIYNLEVYEYIESEYKVKDGSSACPVPLYNKNGYFYYDINTLFTNNQEVLILPRALFEALDPNDFEDPNDVYKFYLTDNAYISYTNDLSEAQIVDSNGETISINLQNSYELSQQYQELYSNPENIFNQMNIFLEKMKKTTGAIKEIFGYLFNSLNSTIKSFIIFIIVVILITTIIRFSRRG